jgi:hypothetical protein
MGQVVFQPDAKRNEEMEGPGLAADTATGTPTPGRTDCQDNPQTRIRPDQAAIGGAEQKYKSRKNFIDGIDY